MISRSLKNTLKSKFRMNRAGYKTITKLNKQKEKTQNKVLRLFVTKVLYYIGSNIFINFRICYKIQRNRYLGYSKQEFSWFENTFENVEDKKQKENIKSAKWHLKMNLKEIIDLVKNVNSNLEEGEVPISEFFFKFNGEYSTSAVTINEFVHNVARRAFTGETRVPINNDDMKVFNEVFYGLKLEDDNKL